MIDKKFILKSLGLFLLLCVILSACNGQSTSTVKDSRNAVGGLTAEANSPTAYKDPLFFIEGQLCQHLRKIFQDSKGHLWFGTNVYDLMHYDGKTLKYITKKEGFSGGRVTGIVEDDTGHIWIASASGLNKYDGKAFEIFDEEDGLSNSEIWSLIIDTKGIFWIGHNEGLSRYDGSQFTNISVPKPPVEEPSTVYAYDRITAIAEDSQGNLWLGTDGYGISKYNGRSFTHYTTHEGLSHNAITELMVDSKGLLWIGTYWGGLSQFDGEKFINFTQDKEIDGVEVSGFFEDTNGDIWLATENNGVYKYDGNSFTHYYKEAGLEGSILSIYRDREKRFWFGGWGGLFRFDGNTFTSVTKDGPWKQ